LKAVAVRHPGFLKLKFLTATHFTDMSSIIVPDFVEVTHAISGILHFWHFSEM